MPGGNPNENAEVEWHRRMYESSNNPLHVWRAYQICSERLRAHLYDGMPLWILAYFDRAAEAVQNLFYESLERDLTKAELGDVMIDALDLKRTGQGVRTDAFSNRKREARDRDLASLVLVTKRQHPLRSFEQIFGDIAERKNLSADVVERAWAQWRSFAEHMIPSGPSGDRSPT
jgi:hypothetical protein